MIRRRRLRAVLIGTVVIATAVVGTLRYQRFAKPRADRVDDHSVVETDVESVFLRIGETDLKPGAGPISLRGGTEINVLGEITYSRDVVTGLREFPESGPPRAIGVAHPVFIVEKVSPLSTEYAGPLIRSLRFVQESPRRQRRTGVLHVPQADGLYAIWIRIRSAEKSWTYEVGDPVPTSPGTTNYAFVGPFLFSATNP